MSDNLVELKSINLTYNAGAANAYQALFDINLEIKQGDFAIILGPSGCGKSSLLNIIAGLEDPQDGSAVINQKDILRLSEKEKVEYHRREIGMIFQSYNLIPTLNVLNNVALPQMFINVGKSKRDQKGLEILEKFGIKEQARKIPTELSGGQQQRIGIARAIVNDPRIILADEPVGNLDSVSSNNAMEILSNLNKDGKTVIMVTHDPSHARWGNRIVHMKDGKITKVEIKDREGSTQEIEDRQKGSGFDEIIDKLRGLSAEQIKFLLTPMQAEKLVEKITTMFSENEVKMMEAAVRDRLTGKIDAGALDRKFDEPPEAGGIGLDRRTAKHLANKIESVISIAKKAFENPNVNMRSEIIVDYIINDQSYAISPASRTSIVALLSLKLQNKINQEEFIKALDMPIKEKGAGLDKRVISEVTNIIDLIMIMGYSYYFETKK